MRQTTDTVVMVRPSHFRKNEDTAVNNYFQTEEDSTGKTQVLALAEFNALVKELETHGMRVVVVPDEGKFDTPDSIFPNNVISFGGDKAILYPMFAPNRREERKLNVLGVLQQHGISFDKVIDYSIYEDQDLFLEGTGVLILDKPNRLAYCSLSPRADEELVHLFCEDFGYTPVIFEAYQTVDEQQLSIYHTNVMMALGTHFCVVCLESILDAAQREKVKSTLERTGKTIVPISEEQMNHFCGNILELKPKDGESLIVMSEQAFKHFTDGQKTVLSSFGKIVHSPLYTIEKFGGGSARCMIAEVFYG